ncbi:phosphatidate cytidylyltransferase [Anaerocolumna aminovalerica]|jgi:phosphatidate cytidylyltransferase|uniref:Phosphatidate cytidylyltransferase n=1 Tax=Anaerocolumna aminovalerica TaxID=1527 RepID=A0A1I5ID71_9FIRM|nr:phosphatidate cytidylyltransferase [Anaerocolumna aminovalerica]MBU5331551.1 phosphatidate cytidylyltransferase [Anaerocolumna aminovalerica]MDU6265438.1 phosphatidate cytidylyltransferase [Anaerocolumna aminovalerica]SFO58535.1 phosphatidate cytidylyltransferase [Anaerocolumna aminovalerica]
MFWIRFRSSIILMIITITTIMLGGKVLFGTVLAISLIGMMELYRTIKMNKSLLGIIGYLACIALDFLILYQYEQYNMGLFMAFLLILLLIYVFTFPKYRTEQVAIVFLGLFYVGVMLSYLYKVRVVEDGAYLVWLIFIGAWGSDTSAYCTGMLIGKHKILPKLSPKKSLEGCIGGVVGAALLGLLYGTIIKDQITGIGNPQFAFAIICGASSVISQIGDLAASAIKRNHDVKDYGNLIPGHGGILDRFDSIIFVAPIVYSLAKIL